MCNIIDGMMHLGVKSWLNVFIPPLLTASSVLIWHLRNQLLQWWYLFLYREPEACG